MLLLVFCKFFGGFMRFSFYDVINGSYTLAIIFVCNHVVSDNNSKESKMYTKNTRLGVNVLFALKHLFVCNR